MSSTIELGKLIVEWVTVVIFFQLFSGFSVDWWALGVLMFEMLAGRSPFDVVGSAENPDQNTEDYLFQGLLVNNLFLIIETCVLSTWTSHYKFSFSFVHYMLLSTFFSKNTCLSNWENYNIDHLTKLLHQTQTTHFCGLTNHNWRTPPESCMQLITPQWPVLTKQICL